MARKLICQWRVSRALPSGLQVWFDPEHETIKLYELEPLPEGGVTVGHERSAPTDPDDSNIKSPPGVDQGDLPF